MKECLKDLSKKKIVSVSFAVLALFIFIAFYAPFLASSKPVIICFDGVIYFPLFRYLFFNGFYTTLIDLFFNLLSVFLPAYGLLIVVLSSFKKQISIICLLLFPCLLIGITFIGIKDPKQNEAYILLDEVVRDYLELEQKKRLAMYENVYLKAAKQRSRLIQAEIMDFPTAYDRKKKYFLQKMEEETDPERRTALEREHFRKKENLKLIEWLVLPLIRPFHWEEDAGGDQLLNKFLPFYELTRLNRRDLTASIIFGGRVSLTVGVLSTILMIIIGVPLGAVAGYYRGWIDIFCSRLMEIWEAIPTLFLLLMVVAILHIKSLFLTIAAIGFFGWIGFARFVRSECLRQVSLAYIESARLFGFSHAYIIFVHLLPNSIAPVLALLPFSVMGAITQEAGISFLGLGEEGSCSWGVLMDEARRLFPAESYLLWPPTIALTLLLIVIAMIGDAVRDVLDPYLKD